MSDKTATRIARPATLAVVAAAALWIVAATALWRTRVPGDLQLPSLDARSVFGAGAVRAGERYDRFFELEWVLGTVAGIAALVVLARRGPRLARSLGLGRVNAGIITGIVVTVVVWAISLPFDIASSWWERRHGISRESWGSIVFSHWPALLGSTFGTFIVLAIILLFAKWLGQKWWIGAAAVILGLALGLQLALPYVLRIGTHPVRSPRLASEIQRLEEREQVGHPAVRIQPMRDETSAANAYAVGIGPSRSVFIWDTMLDGRFPRGEVRFVAAHELGHLARHHIWKGIAWGGLIGMPLLAAAALVTGRRGGLRNPGTVPLALLTISVLQLAISPFTNVVSRRYEAEADWTALQATRDPASARGLFKEFVKTDLQDPDPPGWVHVFLDNHPTALARIQQAEAWRARSR